MKKLFFVTLLFIAYFGEFVSSAFAMEEAPTEHGSIGVSKRELLILCQKIKIGELHQNFEESLKYFVRYEGEPGVSYLERLKGLVT